MRALLDSSALARLYVAQQGSSRVKAILAASDHLGLCVLCGPEVVSALCRLRREGSLVEEDFLIARGALHDDLRAAHIVQLLPPILAIAESLMQDNVLRAADALHVACALAWPADLFVTSDRRQAAAARQAGLHTELITPEAP